MTNAKLIVPAVMLLFSQKAFPAPFNVDNGAIYESGGNVGIGTTNPGALLDVNSSGGEVQLNNNGQVLGYQKLDATTAGMQLRSFSNGGGANTEQADIYLFQTITGSAGGQIRFAVNNGTSLTEAMRILQSGNVGIGTTSPTYKLDVSSWVNASGMYSVAGFFTTSDSAFKENVTPLQNVLPKLTKIQAVSFDWNAKMKDMERDSKGRQIGLIAQEVESEFPELVSSWRAPTAYRFVKEMTTLRGKKVVREVKTPDKWGDFRSLDYGRFTAVLLEAIKEQQKEIEDLKTQVAALQKK